MTAARGKSSRWSCRWLAWALGGVAAFALGCAATHPPVRTHPSAGADPDTLPTPAMYATLCAQCHGADAAGYAADHAPSLVNPTFLESAGDLYLRRSIEEGRPGTSMGAYAKVNGGPLGPSAIGRLAAWIQSHGPAARNLPPCAAGDSVRGRPLYESRCQGCHGDLRSRGNAVMLANPAFLEVASNEFLQHAILEGRPGTGMVSFRGKLAESEIADIVAYVRSLARPVNANRLPAPTGTEPLFAFPRGRDPAFTIKDARYVGVDQVERAFEEKRKLVIIDARPESEWRTTHISGAVSIPHYQLKRLDEIPRDAWVVSYCACPHHLSGIVVDSLRARGYEHAFVLDEGILEWERRGYPFVAAPGTPLPPLEPRSPGSSSH